MHFITAILCCTALPSGGAALLLDDATSCLQQPRPPKPPLAAAARHRLAVGEPKPGGRGAPAPGAVRMEGFAVRVAEDRQSASIIFSVGGEEYRYHLGRFSIFAPDAKVLRHTEAGELPAAEGQGAATALPWTYRKRSRARPATLTVQEGGHATGLFKFRGRYYEVEGRRRSNGSAELEPVPVSLASLHGQRRRGRKTLVASEGRRLSVVEELPLQAAAPLPPITSESTAVHAGRYDVLIDAVDEGHHWHGIPVTDSEGPSTERRRFAGTVWYPGCYTGDSSLHVMKIGIVGDVQAFAEYGAGLQAMLVDYVSKASLVFAGQMNVELQVAYSMIYETAAGAPAYADGCGSNGVFGGSDKDATFAQNLYDMANYYPSNIPDVAALHMFSGCAPVWGIIGLAFVGSICDMPWSVGINKIRDDASQDLSPEGTWLTFAHELGHNVGAQHSFEEGAQATGGIMDYGDGTLDGVYQFNTQYRKNEVCQKLNQRVGQCNGAFEVAPLSAAPDITGPALEPAHVSATGDPHIRNIRGRRFDIHHEGWIRLLQIPKTSGGEASAPSAAPSLLLVVDAESKRTPSTCKGLYLVSINISGTWALERQKGGFHFAANIKQANVRHPHHKLRVLLGPGLRFLVSHGKTPSGEAYLNFHAHELSRAAQSIGGLLGDDEGDGHSEERSWDDCRPAPPAPGPPAAAVSLLLLREQGQRPHEAQGGGRSALSASLGAGDEHGED